MKIGIIGAGQIGGTLTRRFTALGHEVAVANSRGPETLADLAAETRAKPVSIEEATRFGEVVIVTIPEKNIPNLPRDLFAATSDTVVVVETGNYYPRQRDGRIDGIEAGLTVYGKDFDAEGVRRALSQASKERKPEWRGTPTSPGTFENPA